MNNKKPIELLRDANKDRLVYVQFKIPLKDDNYIDAILHAPDMFAIQKEQRIQYELEYEDLCNRGFKKMDINEDKWKAEIKRQTSKDAIKRLEDSKPTSRAEQLANENSTLVAIQELLPKYLKGIDGKLLFETREEQDEFKKIIYSNLELFNLISKKYIELMNELRNIGETAKNSSKEMDVKSGKSKRSSPEDTDTDLSQKS